MAAALLRARKRNITNISVLSAEFLYTGKHARVAKRPFGFKRNGTRYFGPHPPTQITKQMVDEADYIFCMTRRHCDALKSIADEQKLL